MTKLSFILLLLFFPLFAGCTNPGVDCFQIGFPDVGAAASHRGSFFDSDGHSRGSTKFANYSASSVHEVPSGDGIFRNALRMVQGHGAPDYYDLSTGYLIRYEPPVPVVDHRLNYGAITLGSLFWGRCLDEGDTWQAPFMRPDYMLEVVVVRVDMDGAVAAVRTPPVPPIDHSQNLSANRYVYTWKDSSLFPDSVEIYGSAWRDQKMALWVLERQSVVTRGIAAAAEIERSDAIRQVDPWPEFHLQGLSLSYDEFRANVSSRPVVREYLNKHPEAFVSYVRYEEIEEPESHATVWSMMWRDESSEALEQRLVRRCFDNVSLQLLYGRCQDVSHYGDHDGMFDQQRSPFSEVANATGFSAPESVPLSVVLERVRPWYPDDAPVAIEWRAFPQPLPDWHHGYVAGDPSWRLEYGIIQADVDYLVPEPTVWTWGGETDLVVASGSGWIDMVELPGSTA